MHDVHAISTLQQLRDVIPEPVAGIERKVSNALDDNGRRFIAESPLIFVSTTNRQLNIDVSPKGDAAGFVRVEDASTLLIPERSGNRLNFGFRNILETGSIGLIFLIPGVRETLRVNGTAQITRDPALLQQFSRDGKPALLCTRVSIKECFFHCAKALIRSSLWQPEHWPAGAAKESAVKQWSAAFGVDESALREQLEDNYRCDL